MNVNLLSFNLRVQTDHDGPHAWTYRKPFVIEFLKSHDFDVMGFQEITPEMFKDLNTHLDQYESYGIPRDEMGEASPIFIRKNTFEVLESKTLWLTDTPNLESKVKGSHFARIVTYVILKKDQKKLAFFNTHLDYASDEVCHRQAINLSKIIDKVTQKYACSFVLSGDFNTEPFSKTITYLKDRYEMVYEGEPYQLTFHAYTHQTEGLPIDYFFFSKEIKKKAFEIEVNQPKSQFLSDHYPLILNLETL